MIYQKIINLFIDTHTATYIKSRMRAICAKRGVHCDITYKYKMGCNASLKVVLQGHYLNVLNEIEANLNSLNGEVVEENPSNELEKQSKE